MGRKGVPVKQRYDIGRMVEQIDTYLTVTSGIPILKDCCLLYGWRHAYVLELAKKHEELQEAIERLLDTKEVYLERGALSKILDVSMAKFSLKQPQIGWVENVDLSHAVNQQAVDTLRDIFAEVDNSGDGAKAATSDEE